MSTTGLIAADALAGVGGAAVIGLVAGWSSGSPARWLLLVAAAIPVFAAASLQMELARRVAHRSLALILTALVTIATLVQGAGASGFDLGRFGGLLFPVSIASRAAEEPLGLELAARAILPGVLYDLALFAALLALRPMGARSSHADRDRQ
jgi:hypothetical protein